jgi:hypothetical protein
MDMQGYHARESVRYYVRAQFPDGLVSGPLTRDDIREAVKRRKRGVLASVLCDPSSYITASASTMAGGGEAETCTRTGEDVDHACIRTGEHAEQACTRTGEDAGHAYIRTGEHAEHAWIRTGEHAEHTCTRTGEHAEHACTHMGEQAEHACTRTGEDPCTHEEADHLHVNIPVERGEDWDEVKGCMLMLLWANKEATGLTSEATGERLPQPDADLLARLRAGSPDCWVWGWELCNAMVEGIVMGREAVMLAAAQWEDSDNKDQERISGRASADAECMRRVVRAAAREGQGVIVHAKCHMVPITG